MLMLMFYRTEPKLPPQPVARPSKEGEIQQLQANMKAGQAEVKKLAEDVSVIREAAHESREFSRDLDGKMDMVLAAITGMEICFHILIS